MGLKVVLEENPKWDLLREVLDEVATDSAVLASRTPASAATPARRVAGAVALVVCKDDSTCRLLKEYMGEDQKGVLKRELNRCALL